jgi:hypothetical protein
MLRYERVKIKRDTNTVHNRAVPPWEIPMLEWVFDEGNIERLGVFEELPDKDYPDAVNELDRLVRVYGADSKSGVPHANSVYGNARAGVRTLQKLIDDAKAQDDTAAPAPAPARKKGRVERAAENLLN